MLMLQALSGTRSERNWQRDMFVNQAKLSDKEFKKFAAYIYSKCAIKLPPLKKTMLNSRMNRRLRALQLRTFEEYYEYVTSPAGEANELVFLINEVSTNKTDFFREPDHFTYLTTRLLPDFLRKERTPGTLFRVWSAGCSSGEEPYTLAMVLDDFQRDHAGFDFSIFASDISTKVLSIAEKGIYHNERLVTVNAAFRMRYMMRGKGSQNGYHRIVPELQKKITFKRLNFMDASFDAIKVAFDLIICRNVIIYFDRQTQVNLFHKFYDHLKPGGHIFIGHSETMPGMEGKLHRVHTAVYRDCKGEK